MARITRSRQDPALKSETRTTRAAATTKAVAEKGVNGKNSKVKPSTKKASIQDENAVPTTKGKIGNTKSSIKKTVTQSKISVLGSKLHSTKKDNTSIRRNSILAIKSPVLRDRTNTTNELIKSNNSSNKVCDIQLTENKKITKTNIVKKSSKKNNDKNEKDSQVSIKKYIMKQSVVQNKEIIEEDVKENNENENISDKVCSAATRESNAVKPRKRNNLSVEEVKEILNQEDKISEIENIELNEKKSTEEDINVKENEKDNKKITKKFFKHKIDLENIVVNPINRKNPKRQAVSRKKTTAAKKVVDVDNTFSPKIEKQRKSTKPAEKKLRARAVKNYCEVSKVLQDSKSEEKKSDEKAPATENDKKGIPIYKKIELSQEKNKDKEEVYQFPDDSQEDGQKVKKRKRIAKKSTVKRPRKAAVISVPATTSQKIKKKPPSKVSKNVQFKEQEKQPTMEPKPNVNNNVYTNIEIPEDLQNAGDSTIAEASTIKITSDKRLEGSERINLMLTPSAPKTINSELKLFGPKNAITSQPKIQYSNMINHSLIRQSMSPITKEIDDFDIGSPWRPIDAFSRVQKIVQSTPQINRVLAGREKKPLVPMHLNKKSFGSEETIHLSSIANGKLTNQKLSDVTQTQEKNVSPRKFGTVISNLHSMETVTSSSVKQSSIQDKQSSLVKAIVPPISFENDLEIEDNNVSPMPLIPVDGNKEDNKSLISNKSPKKKIKTPSPFRFDRIRSSKRIASIGSQANVENLNSQKENKDPNSIAEPSDSEKSKTAILRQTNLNNFLNLDEMPESTRISTAHGIFDDIHSTPINGKKPQKIVEEPNIENAFGFDDCDFSEEISNIENTPGPRIATKKDVERSVKGKLFPKARVKSTLTRRIPENAVKKTLLKNVLKNIVTEAKVPVNEENAETKDDEQENDDSLKDLENNNKSLENPKKTLVEALTFSDTFDVLSENGEDLSSKVPDEIPLFVDLEPVHFTKPPRRSYNKRKKAVCFDTSRDDSESDEDDDYDRPKKKRKKESKISKEERKKMEEWVKNVNETFEEIDHFDLVVE